VTLHDYFETSHNLYLIFDLCTGGELFDRICAKGNYTEGDAAELVRTIMGAVQYIHSTGIVHRDLKPENLLFRTKDEDADIMIADFGLSRVMDEDKLHLLTEVCGTPGYMAPEIFRKTGHGKPVDIWAMGVITYFLLCGYTPFDRDTQEEEAKAIMRGDYKFEPAAYWANVSDTARDFVKQCLTIDPSRRPTAEQMLKHKWLADITPHFVVDPESSTGQPVNLLPHIQRQFDARRTFRRAVHTVTALKRMSMGVAAHQSDLAKQVTQFKADAEAEHLSQLDNIVYTHEDTSGTPPGSAHAEGSSLQHQQQEQQAPPAMRGLAPPSSSVNADAAAGPSSSSASQKSQDPTSTTPHSAGEHSQEDVTKAMAKASIRD